MADGSRKPRNDFVVTISGEFGYNRLAMEKFTITCPCCEAILSIDAKTGAVLAHEEKGRKLSSFEELQENILKQKEARDNVFAQEMSSHKDRERILDEKFKEAMKRAEGLPDTPFKNPLDLD